MRKIENILTKVDDTSYMSAEARCIFKVVLSDEKLRNELDFVLSYTRGNVIARAVKKAMRKMHLKLSSEEFMDITELLFYYLVLDNHLL